VQFEIFEEPETLVVQRVTTSGAISIPMLGLIQVADRTLLEIEEDAQKAYVAKGYYVHPQVMLTVQVYAPKSVSVMGQVNHPEQIALPIEAARIGIMQAITLAEGFTRLARSDQVLVIRTVGGREEQHTVNIDSYLASKGQEAEFSLRPDDVVFVPERVF
jgi:polysaccharide export outer membrane protein